MASHTTSSHLIMDRDNSKECNQNHEQYLIGSHPPFGTCIFLCFNREKCESSHQRHNRQHNDRKVTSLGSLLGVPVKLSNGIADKNNNQTYIHKRSLGIQTGCLGAPAWRTEPKQLSVVVAYWN